MILFIISNPSSSSFILYNNLHCWSSLNFKYCCLKCLLPPPFMGINKKYGLFTWKGLNALFQVDPQCKVGNARLTTSHSRPKTFFSRVKSFLFKYVLNVVEILMSLIHTLSENAFKGIVMNRTLTALHGGSYLNTL